MKSEEGEWLQSLTEKPLGEHDVARINKVWLPAGRRPAPKAPDHEIQNRRAQAQAARHNERLRRENKMNTLLDYYAKTDVPFSRIAVHLDMEMEAVAKAMKERGRRE